MDTVKLVSDLNGIKAGTELGYDKETGMWEYVLMDEDIQDDIIHSKASRISVADSKIDDYPHLFERISEKKKPSKEKLLDDIYERYNALIDDLLESLENELIELKNS